MNKLYGYAIVFVCGLLMLAFGSMAVMGIIRVITNKSFNHGAGGMILQSIIFILPLAIYFMRGISILKNTTIVSQPTSNSGTALFNLGGVLVVISLVGIVVSVSMFAIGAITKASFGPVGMGAGFSIFPFIIGASLIEICKSKTS